ncbi:unnamed protein product [Musa acuminata subsp. malaccensis]|uniref:(wild Malaysian banana) hypothetical protein n=1 Tax=Musa acuminata subsp. malaccensis TaxID=214687 RepID=A0A804IS82_MUSAM|nr:unnamed protein product [Musa acuminata subsp. malaccensis]
MSSLMQARTSSHGWKQLGCLRRGRFCYDIGGWTAASPPGADLRLFSGAQHLHHPGAHPAVVGGREHDCGLPTPQQLPLLCLCYVTCTIHNKNIDYFVTADPQQHQVQCLHQPLSWATHFLMFHHKASCTLLHRERHGLEGEFTEAKSSMDMKMSCFCQCAISLI